ncbi:hypothetical protein HMI54_009799 [Coelomomyces lativittatus]|nr:hypothetical protein HMI54_009799 [Coelomomyces lativittatus]
MRSEKNHRTLLSSSSSSEPIPASPVPQEAPSSKMLSFFNFLTLTLVLLGVQFTWTVVLGQGTPYLMHLGMPQADTSLVWIMGPLSGFITHPIVGMVSFYFIFFVDSWLKQKH